MRIPNRTAHIKPATREAIMDQLALAANTIIEQREKLAVARRFVARKINDDFNEAMFANPMPRRWWHRFAWWRK